ncbi:hypothetical protein HMPREF0308_0805 [Corynebacterium striatum ATCC 6940]|nr:hypothetical protein HMPREF0308_0805 [Corynebacterium striatum ATCC 6940]
MEALFPTYAGRTAAARQLRGSPAAHPRLRGADLPGIPYAHTSVGSSPLTRGGQRASRPREFCEGLIPAYAGRTAYS